MNINTTQDLEFANTLAEIIALGAGTKDISTLYPDYFGEGNMAKQKAYRVYLDLKPSKLPKSKNYYVQIQNLMRYKADWLAISDFAKLLLPMLRNSLFTELLHDKNEVFYTCFITYKQLTKPIKTPLTFSKAFATYRYLIDKQDKPISSFLIQCNKCSLHSLKRHGGVNLAPCIYCGKRKN